MTTQLIPHPPIASVPPRGRYAHWNTHYLISRVRLAIYERTHADAPWLTRTATEFLASWLRKSDVGLEWGSGRSTHWFASRVAQLWSVEHDASWFEIVSRKLATANKRNVNYRLVNDFDHPQFREHYVAIADELAAGSLDFALVDGLYRADCVRKAIPLIKRGGLLVLDNANWYLPHETRSPDAVGNRTPSSEWLPIVEELASWRLFWTTSGVTDTALFLKP